MSNKKIKIIAFRNIGRLEINTIKNQRPRAAYLKLVSFGDSNYIAFSDRNTKLIFIYSYINECEFAFKDTISYLLPFKKGYQNLNEFTFKSLDSIVISYTVSYFNYIHDTTTFMINKNRELLNPGNFENAPVYTNKKIISGSTKTEIIKKENSNYITNSGDFPMFYHKKFDAIITPLKDFTNYTNYCRDINLDYRYNAGLLYFDGRPFKPLKNIYYDCIDTGLYYPINFKFLRGDYNTKTSEVVFGFGNNNYISVLDTNLNSISIKVNSYILDTIYPSKNYYDEFTDYSKGEFLKITYDKYNDCYYRIIRVGNNIKDISKPTIPLKYQGAKETYIIQQIDNKFKLIAEGIIPEEYNSDFISFIPFNKYLLFQNPIKSLENNKIVFDKIKLSLSKSRIGKYKNLVIKLVDNRKKDFEENSYKEYITTITNKRKTTIIYNTDNACRSCIEYFIFYLKNTLDKIDYEKISVVLITSNKEYLLNQLNRKSLPIGAYIDNTGVYKRYLGDIRNAIKIDINNQSIKTSQYQGDNLEGLTKIIESKYIKNSK